MGNICPCSHADTGASKDEGEGEGKVQLIDGEYGGGELSPVVAPACITCGKPTPKYPEHLKSESLKPSVCRTCDKNFKRLFEKLDVGEPHGLILVKDFHEFLGRAGYEYNIDEFMEILRSLESQDCGNPLCGSLPDSGELEYICFKLFMAFLISENIQIRDVDWDNHGHEDFKDHDLAVGEFCMLQPINEDDLKTFGAQQSSPVQTISIEDGRIVTFSMSTSTTSSAGSKVLSWNSNTGQYDTQDDVIGDGEVLQTFGVTDQDLIRLISNNTAEPDVVKSYVIHTATNCTNFYLGQPQDDDTVKNEDCVMFKRGEIALIDTYQWI